MGRYATNDNLHSQLSKSTAPAQRQIDSERRPQDRYGPCEVREIHSESALNDFTMGGTATGVAWSINPYVGCLHACRYCYVPDTMHVERNRWGSYAVAKHNLPALLRQELKTKKRLSVYVSTSTDPYQAAEREHEITRRCLALLAKHDWPLEILTRSPLVVRDLDLLKRFSRIRVGLSVPTLDDEARRLLEPNAPPIPARLRALRRLADAGLPVFANYSPAYPPTGRFTMNDVAKAYQDAGVQWVNTSYWRRVPSFLGRLWDDVHKTAWRDLGVHIANPKQQKHVRSELAKALKAVKIPLHTGFFNPPFDLTPAYEATSQLKLEVEAPDVLADPVIARPYAEPQELLVVSAR